MQHTPGGSKETVWSRSEGAGRRRRASTALPPRPAPPGVVRGAPLFLQNLMMVHGPSFRSNRFLVKYGSKSSGEMTFRMDDLGEPLQPGSGPQVPTSSLSGINSGVPAP